MNNFEKKFTIKLEDQSKVSNISDVKKPEDLIETIGGAEINNGLFRVLTKNSTVDWNKRVANTFRHKYDKDFEVFGYDWLGRFFGYNIDEETVIMFEIGTGEVLELNNTSLNSFINRIIPESHEDVFASNYFNSWKEHSGNHSIKYDQCVGFQVPLFLNGIDELENLELTNLDVYWGLTSQIIEKVKDLPKGTKIDGFTQN